MQFNMKESFHDIMLVLLKLYEKRENEWPEKRAAIYRRYTNIDAFDVSSLTEEQFISYLLIGSISVVYAKEVREVYELLCSTRARNTIIHKTG